jgi:EpsI family protein
MNALSLKYLLITLALLIAAGAGVALKPTKHLTRNAQKIDLETLIPKHFSDWRLEDSVVPIVNPEQEAALRNIYSQTLTRTYINSIGQRMMLSIAYGDGIDRQLDIHRPEFCYPAQGFEISQFSDQSIQTSYGKLHLRRMVASNNQRIEPISYWIKIGDKSFSSTIERKLIVIKQGLTGKVSSGMLVRISSINTNKTLAFQEQDDFINAMLRAMPDSQRKQLIGDL